MKCCAKQSVVVHTTRDSGWTPCSINEMHVESMRRSMWQFCDNNLAREVKWDGGRWGMYQHGGDFFENVDGLGCRGVFVGLGHRGKLI